MVEHPIDNIMKTTMENLKEMIDVNTIVGDAVETSEGTVIIPISKVTFGFAAGGGEYKEDKTGVKKNTAEDTEGEMPFAGGSGAGVSVNPIAFLVVGEDRIKLLPVQFHSAADRMIDLIPTVVEEIQNRMGKDKKPTRQKEKKTETIITNEPQ